MAGISPVFEGLRPSLLGYFLSFSHIPVSAFGLAPSLVVPIADGDFFLESGLFGPFLHRHKRTGKIKAMAWLSEKLTQKPRASAASEPTVTLYFAMIVRSYCTFVNCLYVHYLVDNTKILTQCLKIAEKVSFNIASEASNVYILSGQKFIKNAQNGQFGEFLKT